MIKGILSLIYNQFGIIQVLQRFPILQTSNWSGTVLLFLTANWLQQSGQPLHCFMKSVSSLDSLLKERIFFGWYIMFSLAMKVSIDGEGTRPIFLYQKLKDQIYWNHFSSFKRQVDFQNLKGVAQKFSLPIPFEF